MIRVPSRSGLRSTFLLAILLTALPPVLSSATAAPAFRLPLAAPSQTPSADSLRARAEEYWRLLVSGDRVGASQFLRPEDRPAFLQGREQPFSNPEVATIELSDDGTRATLEITFDLQSPVGVFPWTIQQEWTGTDGEWMAEPRRSTNPFATPERE